MTDDELGLLRSYEDGPRIWDATAILPTVYALEDKGLIEPTGTSGAYQLTGAGRKELAESGPERLLDDSGADKRSSPTDPDDKVRKYLRRADVISAGHLDTAANIVGGLHLDPINVDGHDVANLLWKISAYLKGRE